MSNTTTVAAPAAQAAATNPNIIFTLKQGTLITIKCANTNNYLTPAGVPGDQFIITTGPGGNDATFEVAFFETNGQVVKVGLQCYQSPYSWGLNSASNYPNGIGLQQASQPTTFLLTPSGDMPAWANIQAAATPPAPYIRMVVDPVTTNQYLARGFNEPSIQGVFEFSIVG